MLSDATFWVAVSFAIFVGLLFYYKVPGMVTKALDKRAADIAHELEEARRLREEAQELLASYQRKQRDAMKEAETIIEQANEEAERLAIEIRETMQVQAERRTKLAEDKISQAEVQAVQEVRAMAADLAVEAARRVIGDKLSGDKANTLIEKSIRNLGAKLH